MIRQKYEIEIEIRIIKGAGALSLTKSDEIKNAKPFLIFTTITMSNFMTLGQREIGAQYVMGKT